MIKTPLSTVIGGAFWTPEATVIGGGTPTFDQYMRKLFANNEQGFAYDPNDLTTLYQDFKGQTPVTSVLQPVGLMLDKSKGMVRSPELVTNGDFTNGSTGWTVTNADATHTATFADGKLHYKTDTVTPALTVQQETSIVNGRTYEVTINVSSYVSGTIRVSGNSNVLINSAGITKTVINNIAPQLSLIGITANVDITIDSISIKEIAGNHSSNTTSGQRPILRDSPRRIDYDGLDDRLRTDMVAPITGATIIRAVPNVGTQILTNQNISATYFDNTNHCGLIVIDRELTATETSQITQLFNKASGV